MDVIIVTFKFNCSLLVYHNHIVCQQLGLNYLIKKALDVSFPPYNI